MRLPAVGDKVFVSASNDVYRGTVSSVHTLPNVEQGHLWISIEQPRYLQAHCAIAAYGVEWVFVSDDSELANSFKAITAL